MPAPSSKSKLLDAPIGELAVCWLGLQCGGCTKSAYIPLGLIASRHGRRRCLRDVLERLRCDHCNAPPKSAWLVDHPIEGSGHAGQVATWRVELKPDAADGGS